MNQSRHRNGSQNPSLSHLFISFLRLGGTASGCPAMAPYIGKIAVEKEHWFNDQSAHVVFASPAFVGLILKVDIFWIGLMGDNFASCLIMCL